MKFVSYAAATGRGFGLWTENGVVDLGRRMQAPDLRALLTREGARGLERARAFAGEAPDFRPDKVTLLPPIPEPAHILCVGSNYLDHLSEVQDAGIDRKRTENPAIFARFPETLVGHGQPLIAPRVSDRFDYEAELAVVIGRSGRYIRPEDALQHVAGYTCFNDGSMRDWQFHTSQIMPGKNFFASGAAGPWMVEATDIADPQALDISLRLNGETLQSSNTSAMIFPIAEIIAYVSAFTPLQPGDIIATGTPAGVGFSRNPPIFMKPGDVCEVEIASLGVLRNEVRAEKP